MIRLQASYGLKTPAAQEYSSQSYQASVEIEVSDADARGGTGPLLALLWTQLRDAVHKEMRAASERPSGPPSMEAHAGQPHGNPARGPVPPAHREACAVPREARAGRSTTPATRKQIGFLFATARRLRQWSEDQTRGWLEREFDIAFDALDKATAAQAIDQLQGTVDGIR